MNGSVPRAWLGAVSPMLADAVIEWSMYRRAEPGDARVATRGAEWFVFEDGLKREIGSSYQRKPMTTELDGFPDAERGYSIGGHEASRLHPEAIEFTAPMEA